MERVRGIEPPYSAWEAAALPLSYTRAGPVSARAAIATGSAASQGAKRDRAAGRFGGGDRVFPVPARLALQPIERARWEDDAAALEAARGAAAQA